MDSSKCVLILFDLVFLSIHKHRLPKIFYIDSLSHKTLPSVSIVSKNLISKGINNFYIISNNFISRGTFMFIFYI